MSRAMTFLLAGSLAVNLLLVGFLAGGAVRGGPFGPFGAQGEHAHYGHMPPGDGPMQGDDGHRGPPRPFHAAMGMAWAMHGLPEARREALRPTFEASFAQIRPQLRGLRDAQRDVATALDREQFQRAELERALAAMQARMRTMEATSQRALVDMAAQLTFEERKQLARTLREPPFPFRRRMGPPMEGDAEDEAANPATPPGTPAAESPAPSPAPRAPAAPATP